MADGKRQRHLFTLCRLAYNHNNTKRINGLLSPFGWGRWGVSQRNHEQWLVHHAEKVTEIGDYEVISF
jgi:hypothetical protein